MESGLLVTFLPRMGPVFPIIAGLLAALLTLVLVQIVAARARRASILPPPREPAADAVETPPGDERRQSVRRRGKPVLVHVCDAEAKTKPRTGWVVDRSTGGLGLELPLPVTVDTVLNVRATNAPSTVSWVRVRVRHCTARDGRRWFVGCQFLETVPWNVLLLFG